MAPLERGWMTSVRRELLAGASGRVVEIGAGTGVNFPFYANARQVVAVEPDGEMLRRALVRAATAPAPVGPVRGDALTLPFADAAFDAAVGTLVFCTVADPRAALRELRRVVRPGGRVLLFEHVRMPHPLPARLQDWLTPLWSPLCGGCRLNRDTLADVRASGLSVRRVRAFAGGLFLTIEAENPPAPDAA